MSSIYASGRVSFLWSVALVCHSRMAGWLAVCLSARQAACSKWEYANYSALIYYAYKLKNLPLRVPVEIFPFYALPLVLLAVIETRRTYEREREKEKSNDKKQSTS